MRTLLTSLVLALLAAAPAAAQTNGSTPSVSGKPWFDLFAGRGGTVIYPQYNLRVETRRLVLTGYGFWERAPQEPDFTNHVNTVTWSRVPQFSLRTETGGRVREFWVRTDRGDFFPIPPAAFFQIGPQVNLHKVFPLPGVDYLVASYLPALAGIRTNNTLLAGGTKPLQLGPVSVTLEGYRRFFPDGGPDYAEYWFLAHPARLKHVSLGAFLLTDGKAKHLLLGGRLSP